MSLVDDLLVQVRASLRAKAPAEAIELLRAAVNAAPKNISARVQLARLLDQTRQAGDLEAEIDAILDGPVQEQRADPNSVNQLLKAIHYASSEEDRNHRLLAVLAWIDSSTPRTRHEATLLRVSHAGILLGLWQRDAFAETVRGLKAGHTNQPAVLCVQDAAARWSAPTFPDRAAPKVFVIGLSRTGTLSMHWALARLGYRSQHYTNTLTKDLLRLRDMDLFDACGDISVTARFETLYARFPNARFIQTTRPQASWIRSVQRHYLVHSGVRMPNELLERGRDRRYGGRVGQIHKQLYADHITWDAAYDAHEARVASFFNDKPADKLLRFSVFDGHGWGELCAFLDQPTPDSAFPHKNIGQAGQATTT
ncbi:sulfotransferase [uncultured Thiohalocapsa sp.]|uniref:sulfotransferase n=1 Tax=uncultured Thiohalocapsa sp. TaxID=768990 RepID=UPI0025EA645B|nr:sulfotransferase [uncultured Thiohalocapsa sp.]